MATGAVLLGAWIGESSLHWYKTLLLAVAALFSTGFGNVINDIFDHETDRISHPERPIPQGHITLKSAVIYSVLLGTGALASAVSVAPLFGFATLIPVLLLLLYALFLKRTPLAGNIIVSILVAYALLFGALQAPFLSRLFIPALLALLLNFTREIIKDVQDKAGDTASGITTTAILRENTLLHIIRINSIAYLLLLYIPFISGTATVLYAITVSATALPLHIFRTSLLLRHKLNGNIALISRLVKTEMLAGLLALSLDHLFR